MAALPLMLAVSRAGARAAPRADRGGRGGRRRAGRGDRHPAVLRRGQGAAGLRRRAQRTTGRDRGAVRGGAGGLGAGRPDRAAGRAAQRARLVLAVCAVLFAVPVVWVARRDRRSARSATACASPGGSRRPGRTRWRRSGWPRCSSGWCWARRRCVLLWLRLRGRLGVTGVRRRSRWRWWCSTCSRRGWATTRRSRRATRSSRPRPRSATSRASARTASPGCTPRRRSRWPCRSRRTWRCATGSTTRAATTSRSRSATRELWRRAIAAVAGLQLRVLPRVGRALAARAAGRSGCSGVTDLLQNQRDPPLRGFEVGLRGPGRARLPQPGRAAARVPGRAPAGRATAATRRATRSRRPASRRATSRSTEQRIDGIPRGRRRGSPAATRASSSYGDERVDVDTDRRRARSLLVLTDSWFPGWKATVDGHDVPIERVDYLIRGVPVPAGAHRVEFRYEPASWRAGWIVSLLALIVILAAGLDRLAAPCVSCVARRPDGRGRAALPGAGARDVRARAGAGPDAVGLRRALDRRAVGGGAPGRRAAASAPTSTCRTPPSSSSRPCRRSGARCRTSRSGTRTRSAAGRCSATRSRRSSRRSACRRTCCRSGSRWPSSRR